MITFLEQLFRAHGIETVIEDDWVVFPGHCMRAGAAIVRETPGQGSFSVQLDVRVEIGPGRTLLESFAGLGATREQAISNAQQAFVLNSFHVILAAFFAPADPHVSREEWDVGGDRKRVTLGTIGIRGQLPQPELPADWFKRFESRLKTKKLRSGAHWVRCYYAQVQRRPLACEVLLDNAVWQELQAELAADSNPPADAFYSLRVFLLLQDGLDVSQVVGTICQHHNSKDAAVVEALIARGASRSEAEKLLGFVTLAFGRVLLKGLGIHFADSVVLCDPDTDARREVALADEPAFVEATRLAEEAYTHGTMGRERFAAVALRGAEVDAVNKALHAGSRPEDLVCSPTMILCSAAPAPPGER